MSGGRSVGSLRGAQPLRSGCSVASVQVSSFDLYKKSSLKYKRQTFRSMAPAPPVFCYTPSARSAPPRSEMKVRNRAIEGFKIPDPRFSRVGRGYSYKTYNEVCNRTAGTCATIDRAAEASSPRAASEAFVCRPPRTRRTSPSTSSVEPSGTSPSISVEVPHLSANMSRPNFSPTMVFVSTPLCQIPVDESSVFRGILPRGFPVTLSSPTLNLGEGLQPRFCLQPRSLRTNNDCSHE